MVSRFAENGWRICGERQVCRAGASYGAIPKSLYLVRVHNIGLLSGPPGSPCRERNPGV